MDYNERNVPDHRAYRVKLMKIIDVVLRVPILYFLDGLFSGLWLCYFAKIVGFSPRLDVRTLSSLAANLTKDNSNVSRLNEEQSLQFPSENNVTTKVNEETAVLEIPSFFDALFSWNSGCEKLWIFMSWPAYLSLNLLYFLSEFRLFLF